MHPYPNHHILLTMLMLLTLVVMAADPTTLDFGKPIQVDLWSAPPDQATWLKSGIDPKVGHVLRSTDPSRSYESPMLIGCVLTGGEIRRPFAVPYGRCTSTDDPLFVVGGNCEYRYLRHT